MNVEEELQDFSLDMDNDTRVVVRNGKLVMCTREEKVAWSCGRSVVVGKSRIRVIIGRVEAISGERMPEVHRRLVSEDMRWRIVARTKSGWDVEATAVRVCQVDDCYVFELDSVTLEV